MWASPTGPWMPCLEKIPGDHGIYGGIVIFNGLAKVFFYRKP